LVKLKNRPTLVWHWFGYSSPRVYNTAKQKGDRMGSSGKILSWTVWEEGREGWQNLQYIMVWSGLADYVQQIIIII
jgi:hypothetical protein